VATVEDPVDPAIERILVESFPEMRQALAPDGLAVEAFEDFGPVQYFRDRFIAGWDAVRAAISEARQGAQAQGAQR
jgi:hypothetical protein